ncbi:hypothetical protein BAUCODRAFT_306219 [Baudoinia panamericana UAMH 10762]|uniref:Uncharacterized protein n=1 Tax=Baudoinia panamericana (strain UAMH 10762) TaxID=717646 RepID=M2M5C9_BAUPA|nr:uncharacterized protein BAUCODRAFT_306219 [Baudoinia panamericana UAMH 10762]EMC91831.1 hypothetical protein BAUCODRAFT_306219 [Baudoinia panamericana UAMH 10762]
MSRLVLTRRCGQVNYMVPCFVLPNPRVFLRSSIICRRSDFYRKPHENGPPSIELSKAELTQALTPPFVYISAGHVGLQTTKPAYIIRLLLSCGGNTLRVVYATKRDYNMSTIPSQASSPLTSPSLQPDSKMTEMESPNPSATYNVAMHEHLFSSCILRKQSFDMPSAYVSDEDLFGDDLDGFLDGPPAPPRPADAYLAQPLLPPVTKDRRRSSSSHYHAKSTKYRSYSKG